nr:hypothetical protein [Tanacetum cinerariifolium]
MSQNIDFSGYDQIQTPQYPDVHPPSQEIKKEEPPQDSDIHQLIKECSTKVSEEQKQSIEDTMLELVKICQKKEFLCIHDNEEQEVKNVVEQQAEESNAENLLPIPSECEDIEYVEASLSDREIVSEEENVVHQAEENDVEEEEVDLEDISQIQNVVLREKLLSIIRLIYNIESLNDNPTPDCVLNSFEPDNSLSDNFRPNSKLFVIIRKRREVERLINVMKNDIPDNSSNDPLLEEADLFLSDNSISPGIENVADDPEGNIRFLEELLTDDSILSHESSDSNFEDNPSIPRPPPEPPDAETDAGKEIPVVMNDKDKFDEDYYFS